MNKRVQLRRAKGWRMPPNTVKVDRSTPWGNPFIVGVDGTRERCVELFATMLGGWICLTRLPACADAQIAYRKHLQAHWQRLEGKDLACWCPPGQPCHADLLLQAVAHLASTTTKHEEHA